MWRGLLPVHSALASIFLEFPIWIFVLYIILLCKIVSNTFKNQQVGIWTMIPALIMGTLWYSGHNEPYFLALLLVGIGAMEKIPDKQDK
ncbi:hypothetical protein CRD59_02965 [Bifidobacterium xylocopae]|uniref:Uncharacterized protein n=2 Tax=Bifidobacterium xylocopae TaxID=2493119 RepID=A0A366KG83_9BIFI|nr:hypothetical protein CRD59_02965 [Bifidobacterium xylocopae]